MQIQELTKRAKGIARFYTSRVSGLDEDDIYGEAVLAQVAAAPKYNEAQGSWRGYAHRAATRAVRDAIRLRYPVSGRRRQASNELRDTRGVLFVEGHLLTDSSAVEHNYLVRAVRERVVELVGEDGAEFALLTLTGEFKPAEVAQDNGCDVSAVYAAENRIRRVLRDDYRLRKLWEAL